MGRKLLLRGWAANLRRGRAARYVLVFSAIASSAWLPPLARVDLRRRTDIVALQRAGFLAEVPLLGCPGRAARAAAGLRRRRGVASRLPFRGAAMKALLRPRPAGGVRRPVPGGVFYFAPLLAGQQMGHGYLLYDSVPWQASKPPD